MTGGVPNATLGLMGSDAEIVIRDPGRRHPDRSLWLSPTACPVAMRNGKVELEGRVEMRLEAELVAEAPWALESRRRHLRTRGGA
jgi:hypothetical protein